MHAGGHLVEAFGDVSHGRTERAVEGVGPDMFEHDVDALLPGDLARLVLETVLAIIDDVVGAECLYAVELAVIADGGDDSATDRLGHHDRDGTDAGATSMHEHRFARLQFRVVEQHVLDCRKCDRRAGGVAFADGVRYRYHQPLRHIEGFARETVDMEAHDAGDVLTEIVAALPAAAANPTGEGAVHDNLLSRRKARDAFADGGNFSGGLGADHQRQLPLRKSHAAVAPNVDVIERHRFHADLHLARPRA